jgi:hypothetical protein
MLLQKNWVLSIQPKAAMFKFRAPRADDAQSKFVYLVCHCHPLFFF